MKATIISFCIAITLISYVNAQPAQKKEKVEAMKVGFITNQLNLTPEEAQSFWPVYNQYEEKLQTLRQTRKMEHKEATQSFDTMSDKEIEVLVENEMGFKQKELEIQKEYHAKFKSVLPIRKVAKLYRAEEMFKRELIKKIQGPPGPHRK